jgi:hypothetical protein
MKFKTKLTALKGAPRSKIWIEGKKLSDYGFNHKQAYIVTPDQESVTIHLDTVEMDDVIPTKPRFVAGTPTRPIIDLGNKQVALIFEGHTHVECEFEDGSITVRGVQQSIPSTQ